MKESGDKGVYKYFEIYILFIKLKIIYNFRTDLATNILIRYKNNPTRLAMAMDKLLDREVHPFLSSAMDGCWYQIRDPRNLPLMTMKNVATNNILTQRKYILIC